MKKTVKLIALLTALLLTAMLFGCSATPATGEQPSQQASQQPSEAPSQEASQDPTAETTDAPADPTDAPTDAPTDVPTDAPTNEPADPDRYEVSAGSPICGFENGKTSYTLFDLSVYDFYVPPSQLISDSRAESGNALNIKINYTAAYGTMLLLVDPIDSGFSEGFAPAADYDYLRMWVVNNADSELNIGVVLVTADQKNTALGPEGAFIIDSEGNPEDCYPTDAASVNAINGTGDTHICIPGGFEGWVYFSIANQDQVPWWNGTTLTDDEILNVAQIQLDLRYDDGSGAENLIIDGICLANED